MFRSRRDHDDEGFTLIEVLVALLVVAGTSAAFGAVLVTTTKFAREDDLRGRASQVAAREVERMRATPWTTAAVAAPSTSCINGELVRVTTSPALVEETSEVDVGGLTLAVRNAVTWVGTACGAVQPTYGRLRMTSRVSWTENAKNRYTEVVSYRLPPSDYPVPLSTATASPTSTATASASPTPSASASATATPSSTPSSSPSPTTPALITPTFSNFTPAPPKRFCAYDGQVVEAVPLSVDVAGVTAGEAVTLTWGQTGQSASTTTGGVTNGVSRINVTLPVGAAATVGVAKELRISISATGTHTASTHSETFEVYQAQNKNKCT